MEEHQEIRKRPREEDPAEEEGHRKRSRGEVRCERDAQDLFLSELTRVKRVFRYNVRQAANTEDLRFLVFHRLMLWRVRDYYRSQGRD